MLHGLLHNSLFPPTQRPTDHHASHQGRHRRPTRHTIKLLRIQRRHTKGSTDKLIIKTKSIFLPTSPISTNLSTSQHHIHNLNHNIPSHGTQLRGRQHLQLPVIAQHTIRFSIQRLPMRSTHTNENCHHGRDRYNNTIISNSDSKLSHPTAIRHQDSPQRHLKRSNNFPTRWARVPPRQQITKRRRLQHVPRSLHNRMYTTHLLTHNLQHSSRRLNIITIVHIRQYFMLLHQTPNIRTTTLPRD